MADYTCEWDKDGDGTFSEDISGYVMECKIERGRKTDLETMPPGTATLVLNNADGRFSPDKAAGPYYGDVFMYSRVRIKVNHSETDYGLFWGWLLGWDNKPKSIEQNVTWFLGDRFAILQDRLVSLRMSRNIPVATALHKVLDTVEGVNVIDNPSVEENLTGYAALQGITPVRDSTMNFDGDWVIREDCPGDNANEGWVYDVTSMIPADVWYQAGVFVRVAEGSESLRFRARDNLGTRRIDTETVGMTWKHLTFSNAFLFHADSANRYLEFYTNGTFEIVFYTDLLLAWPVDGSTGYLKRNVDSGTAEIELLAAYRESALEVLQAIVESEPRVFSFPLYWGEVDLEYIVFADKDYRDTAIGEGPVATFSDDGGDIPYHDLVLGEDAIDRISEVEVVSQGTYLDENEEVTIWELSPVGQLVDAAATIKFRARYSQPARDCSLDIDPMAETFKIPGGASDGKGGYTGAGWVPDVWQSNTNATDARIGSYYTGSAYGRFRTYLRFDTSGIPDGADVESAKLRLRMKINWARPGYKLNVREKAWYAGLAEDDWSAVPGLDDLVGFTESLVPAEQWFEIELDIAYINKEGDTEFCLSFLREETATQPTGGECIDVYTMNAGTAYCPQLVVNYSGLDQGSSTFENYGVGADIEITAGAAPLYVTAVEVKGKPLQGTSEEAKVIAAVPSPPPVDRTLSVALPLQGSRTASMEAEATRLAARYGGRIRRPALVLRPVTDACLTQMLVREIGDLIHLENISSAYGTWLHGDYWIEGIEHSFEEDGSSHETVFYLEEVGGVIHECTTALAGGGTLDIAGVCTLVGTAPLVGEGTLSIVGTV